MQLDLLQHHLPLASLPPLVPLEFFACCLGKKMNELIDDCDTLVFGHAWNISATAKGYRRELRVFFIDGLSILHGKPLPAHTYEECHGHIVPATRGLRGAELQRLWTCGPDLIHDLEAAGQLIVERDRLAAKGPRASKLYSRDSILAFLNRRAIGDPAKN